MLYHIFTHKTEPLKQPSRMRTIWRLSHFGIDVNWGTGSLTFNPLRPIAKLLMRHHDLFSSTNANTKF